MKTFSVRKEGNVLFNDALNIFYLIIIIIIKKKETVLVDTVNFQ